MKYIKESKASNSVVNDRQSKRYHTLSRMLIIAALGLILSTMGFLVACNNNNSNDNDGETATVYSVTITEQPASLSHIAEDSLFALYATVSALPASNATRVLQWQRWSRDSGVWQAAPGQYDQENYTVDTRTVAVNQYRLYVVDTVDGNRVSVGSNAAMVIVGTDGPSLDGNNNNNNNNNNSSNLPVISMHPQSANNVNLHASAQLTVMASIPPFGTTREHRWFSRAYRTSEWRRLDIATATLVADTTASGITEYRVQVVNIGDGQEHHVYSDIATVNTLDVMSTYRQIIQNTTQLATSSSRNIAVTLSITDALFNMNFSRFMDVSSNRYWDRNNASVLAQGLSGLSHSVQSIEGITLTHADGGLAGNSWNTTTSNLSFVNRQGDWTTVNNQSTAQQIQDAVFGRKLMQAEQMIPALSLIGRDRDDRDVESYVEFVGHNVTTGLLQFTTGGYQLREYADNGAYTNRHLHTIVINLDPNNNRVVSLTARAFSPVMGGQTVTNTFSINYGGAAPIVMP